MMYYVESPRWTNPANRKCEEIVAYVCTFGKTLVADDKALKRMIEEIRSKVEDLNEAFPRTKKVVVRLGITDKYIICHPEPRTSDSDTIFTMSFLKVDHLYGFEDGSDIRELK